MNIYIVATKSIYQTIWPKFYKKIVSVKLLFIVIVDFKRYRRTFCFFAIF